LISYGLSLFCLLLVTVFASDRRLAVTSLVLCCNWLANSAIVAATGETYPFWFYIATDYIAGFVILIMSPLMVDRRVNLWQVTVTLIFAAQLICHARYGLSPGNAWVEYYSWYFLSYTAWLQLVIVGVWAGYELLGRPLRFVRGVLANKSVFNRVKKG
jgi:hypothetical protein